MDLRKIAEEAVSAKAALLCNSLRQLALKAAKSGDTSTDAICEHPLPVIERTRDLLKLENIEITISPIRNSNILWKELNQTEPERFHVSITF